jgi:hypothetical protein
MGNSLAYEIVPLLSEPHHGKHIIEKTGNVAAVQRQLGHKNAV